MQQLGKELLVKMNDNNTQYHGTEANPHNIASNIKDNIVQGIGASVRLIDTLAVTNGVDPFVFEQYRILHTKLDQICRESSYKTIAVTSAVQAEGKSITSLSLAYVMANVFKKRVLLIECDLKKPTLASYIKDTGNRLGLVNVLNEEVALNEAITKLETDSLYFLLAGNKANNSAELLSSQHMSAIMDQLKPKFDYIIVDSTPILPLADVNILAGLVDGFVLVVRAGKTPRSLVLKAVNSMSNGNFVGIVLNKAEAISKKYYYSEERS